VSFPRLLAAGAVISLLFHGVGSAYFAKSPDDVSIAASEGGGVSVIGSIEDLVAGVEVETVSPDQMVDEVEPETEPVAPVKVNPARPVVEPVPVEAAVEPLTAAPVVQGVTSVDPVTAVDPAEPKPAEPVERVKPVDPAAAVEQPPVREIPPVEPAPEQKPIEIAKAEPVDVQEPLKPVEQETEVQEPLPDPLQDVTQIPVVKPKPPVRKTEPKKTPVKEVRNRGAEVSSRKGGERVTSQTARSNANGRANAKTNDGGTKATSNYKGKVVAKLRRAKRYPKQARRQNLEGTVRVAFTISANGSVSGIRVSRSSGHTILDQAAVDMVRRASPMPKFPSDIRVARMNLQVPVRFNR